MNVMDFFAWRCCAHQDNIRENLKQITTEIPKSTPEDFKKKCKTLLTDIGGEWYLNNMRNPKPHMNNMKLSNKQQQEENNLQVELKVACDHWKYWKSQIH